MELASINVVISIWSVKQNECKKAKNMRPVKGVTIVYFNRFNCRFGEAIRSFYCRIGFLCRKKLNGLGVVYMTRQRRRCRCHPRCLTAPDGVQRRRRRQRQQHRRRRHVNGPIGSNVIHFHGNFAVDADGNFALLCKRTLIEFRMMGFDIGGTCFQK